MAKSRRLSKAAIDLLKEADPRELADQIGNARLSALLNRHPEIRLSVDLALKVEQLLRLVPRLPHRSRLTTRELRNKEALIEKALELKRKLHEGMSEEDAEVHAANRVAKRAGAEAPDILLQLRWRREPQQFIARDRLPPPPVPEDLIAKASAEVASLRQPRPLKNSEKDAAELMAEFSDYKKSTILRGMRLCRE